MRRLRIIFVMLFVGLALLPVHAQACSSPIADTPPSLTEHAKTCNIAEDYDRALADLNQALTLDPNYAPAAYNRGITYMNLGNYERALIDLQYALDLRFERPETAYTLIGWSNVNLSNYEAAIAAFEQAVTLNPQEDFAFWGLGDSYRALGDFDRAVGYYHQHLDIAGEYASPVVRAYVGGYEGEPRPMTSSTGGRTNWEILGAFLLAGIGLYVRFSFARNIVQRNLDQRKKPKHQQVIEQTRDLERTYEREKQSLSVAPAAAIQVNQHHPDNAGVLDLLRRPDTAINQSPPDNIGPAGVGGINSNVVTYIWETLAKLLPQNCNWRVYDRVALVHPENGLIFCLALPGGIVALRLPDAAREAVIAAVPNSLNFKLSNGKEIQTQRFGPDWVFVGSKAQHWVRAAYDYAGEQGRRALSRADY